MRNSRILAIVLAALPLVAFDCGGKDPAPTNPFGTCNLHVSGPGVSEDLWCVAAVWDYSVDPGGGSTTYTSSEWGFILSAYRGGMTSMDVGGGVGMYLQGPPKVGFTYGWDGASVTTTALDGGSATRYDGTGADTHETHSAVSLAETGKLMVKFTQIPPPGDPQAVIQVHGSLSGTLEPVGAGTTVRISATF